MKYIIVTLAVAVTLISGTFFVMRGRFNAVRRGENNVTLVDGKQIIEIRAKGGYTPSSTIAQANVPTILRFITSGTFDCSSAVRIPALGISKNLPFSGTTDIEVGSNPVGTLQGTCGMGMYPFEINFKD